MLIKVFKASEILSLLPLTDFFFITLFLGNDFIPRGPFAHKLEDFITEMVDKYKELKSDGFTGLKKIPRH